MRMFIASLISVRENLLEFYSVADNPGTSVAANHLESETYIANATLSSAPTPSSTMVAAASTH